MERAERPPLAAVEVLQLHQLPGRRQVVAAQAAAERDGLAVDDAVPVGAGSSWPHGPARGRVRVRARIFGAPA